MVVIYFQTQSGIQSQELDENNYHLLDEALWIDLIAPTKNEEIMVEERLKLGIPTKEEIEEIEPSSRLYIEDNVLFMTATMVAMSDLPEVKTDVVTFILTEKKLITVRYNTLRAFDLFSAKLLRSRTKEFNATSILINLLDATTERLADILEKISHTFDEVSRQIFHQKAGNHSTDYKKILENIGANADLGTKTSESLISLIRLISFLEQTHGPEISKDMRLSLMIIHKDVSAINDYASFLSTKFNFLLDATLGMINIEQNNIIKIFSVAAVVFLPPTLIASIYGMNFNHMPELQWYVGYPLAIIMMFFSAWIPFSYFKRKKWF